MVVPVPVVIEPVVLVELLNLLAATSVYIIGRFVRSFPLLASLLKYLIFRLQNYITLVSFNN